MQSVRCIQCEFGSLNVSSLHSVLAWQTLRCAVQNRGIARYSTSDAFAAMCEDSDEIRHCQVPAEKCCSEDIVQFVTAVQSKYLMT